MKVPKRHYNTVSLVLQTNGHQQAFFNQSSLVGVPRGDANKHQQKVGVKLRCRVAQVGKVAAETFALVK